MKNHYVITGTSRGIGLELTKQLLQQGQVVTALSRNSVQAPGLQSLKQKFPETLRLYNVDVRLDGQVLSFVRDLGEATVVDVLINNAGAYLDGDVGLEQLSLQKVTDTFDVNTIAPIRMTQALLPQLKQSKQPKIVHITSLMGSITDNTSGGSYGYRMSKSALNMFCKSFSVDYPEIITAVIHPGWVQTDMGGPQAPTPAEESARGIIKVVQGLGKSQTGKFFDYEGDELSW